MNYENKEFDLTKVDLACDYQSGSKFKKYDLISFQIIEKNIRLIIQDVDLENILKMITIASNDELISIVALKYILYQFVTPDKAEAILEWLILPYFFIDKENDESSTLSQKESYEEYLCFNLKLLISKELDCFSFSTLFAPNDEKKDKRGSPRFNLDNSSRITHLDLICVLLFFIFFCKEKNEKKSELLFDILDYDRSGQLKTGKKVFYVIFRKMVLLSLFYPDIIMNYSISKHSSDPNMFLLIDKEYALADSLIESNKKLTLSVQKSKSINETKGKTNDFNADRLIFYQTFIDLVFEYKIILFYLRHSRGIMKDLVTFISHSFVFYENKTNPIVSKELFKSLCKDSQYSIFLPGIYREYLIEYLFHNQRRSTLFFSEFPKIIHHLEELKINNKHYIKREQSLLINELNLKEEYLKYETILDEKGFIMDFFINTEKYINKKDMNDLKKQKYKKRSKVTQRELDKEITEINDTIEKKSRKDVNEKKNTFAENISLSRSLENMSSPEKSIEEVKEPPRSTKSKASQLMREEREENEKKEKELLKLGSFQVDIINEEDIDINEGNETISIVSQFENIDRLEKIVPTKNNVNNSLKQLNTSISNKSNKANENDGIIDSDDDEFDDASFNNNSKLKLKINIKQTNQSEVRESGKEEQIKKKLSVPKMSHNDSKDNIKQSIAIDPHEKEIVNKKEERENKFRNVKIYKENENENDIKESISNENPLQKNQEENMKKKEIPAVNPSSYGKIKIYSSEKDSKENNEIKQSNSNAPKDSNHEQKTTNLKRSNIYHINSKNKNKKRNDNDNKQQQMDYNDIELLQSDTSNLNINKEKNINKDNANANKNQSSNMEAKINFQPGTDHLRFSPSSSPFKYNEEDNQITYTDDQKKNKIIKQGEEALEAIPKQNDNFSDTYSENKSIINLTSQLDNQKSIKIDNDNHIHQSQNRGLDFDLLLKEYFASIDTIKKTPIDQIKASLHQINDSIITQCTMLKFKENFKQFNKNKIQTILSCQIKEDLMNLYLKLMAHYNTFLRENNEIELKVVFFDTQFFQLLQESCHSNSFTSLCNQYQNDFFVGSPQRKKLIFDDDYLIVVPIYVYVNLANSEQKKLFLALINNNKRLITFFDSDDVLNDNSEIVTNYKILFDSLFAYLMKEQISKKNLQGWECECNSIDSMCYEEEYAELIMVYYTQLICKTGKIRLISDKEYSTIRDNLFKEIAGFFIKVHDYLN